jgi:hypothetical protein
MKASTETIRSEITGARQSARLFTAERSCPANTVYITAVCNLINQQGGYGVMHDAGGYNCISGDSSYNATVICQNPQ